MRTSRLLLAVLVAMPALSFASGMTQVLRPGWMRYEIESQWEGRLLQADSGGIHQELDQRRVLMPVSLYIGGSDGIEAVVKLPLAWHRGTEASGGANFLNARSLAMTGSGIGDLALGVKIKLLEDTGRTPAFFIESLLKFPTGESALYAYARSLGKEASSRGTGSGSFDLVISTIISAYLHPLESYLKLEIAQRGSNDVWAAGAGHRVDYGARTSAVAGLQMDLGRHFELALESRADVFAADTWTVGGSNVLDGLGNSVESFRDAALTQADLHLGSTTEWYIGPRIDWKPVQAFGVSIRGEAGLTPDSPRWRVSAGLTGFFNAGLKFGSAFDRKEEIDAQGVTRTVVVQKVIETSDDRRDMVVGNLQRYIYTRYEEASKAQEKGDFEQMAFVVKVLEDLDPTPGELRPRIDGMREKLFLLAAESHKKGNIAAGKRNWLEAVRAWKEALSYRPDFEPTVKAMKDSETEIAVAARSYYRKGIDAYVNKEDIEAALDLWNQTLELNPNDVQARDSIVKAKKKMEALRKLK